jgi:multisubunit Na+/H+ antiporter MnhB subunit
MKGMTVIVRTIARWVKVFIFLYGCLITITGHLTPGGGFAGGVIIAASFILITLADGKELALKQLPLRAAAGLDSLGGLLFLVVALLGIGFGGIFFANWIQRRFPGGDFHLLSSGAIPVYNIAICLKVGASLFITFVIMSVLRIVVQKDGSFRMVQDEEEE